MALTKLLFVDDEPAIRLTLPLILEQEGFQVTTAASVGEALELIKRERFDILISDLNIGQPGDGFTVVSVMRRVQPDAVTFILTGYPDFESALEAIRAQVDDYLTKPVEIPSLVATLRQKLASRGPIRHVVARRAPELVLDHLADLLEAWLAAVSEDLQLRRFPISAKDRIDNFPEILSGICARALKELHTLDEATAGCAMEHGISRFQHGYSPDLILVETRLLQREVSRFLQQNLLAIDLSTLIPDVMRIADLTTLVTEESVRAFNTRSRAA